MASSTANHAPIVIEKEIQLLQRNESNDGCDENDKCQQVKLPTKTLNLLMLGCETKVPYGPLEHTAQLFLDVISLGAIQSSSLSSSRNVSSIFVRMHIYNVQNMEYPNTDEWDQYDGIIIPGSFSAAYDSDPWIEQLKLIIQTQIVPYHRKTLGICFGHQIIAHSFSDMTTASSDKSKETSLTMGNEARATITATSTTFTERFGNTSGLAIPTPSGPRAGHFTMPLTFAGKELLLSEGLYPNEPRDSNDTSNGINTTIDATTKNQQEVELYFTHGDMVSKIPDDVAVLLGGDDRIPIQSVAYFASIADVQQYKDAAATANDNYRLPSNDLDSFDTQSSTTIKLPLPYAITFQAHPEYSASMELGITRTLFQCMDAMETRCRGQDEQQHEHESTTTTTTTRRNYTIQSRDDAIRHFPHVQKDSIAIIARVGQIFGWFQ